MDNRMKKFLKKLFVWNIYALIAVMSVLSLRQHAYASPTERTEEEDSIEGSAYVLLDISEGSIVITETGYLIGDAEEEIPFEGVYYITGTADEGSCIRVVSGEHTLIIKNVEIDHRTEEDGCPLKILKEAVVNLNINGDNIFYAGAGCCGIELEAGAQLNMNAYGKGSLSVLAYPKRRGNFVYGDRAVYVPLKSVISYPQWDDGDRMEMYCDLNRRETRKVFVYSGQTFMKLEFEIGQHEHVPSDGPDCVHAQICLLCAQILAETDEHMPEGEATCTEDALCSLCGEVAVKATGHQGVWQVLGYNSTRTLRREMMICNVCHQVLYRNVEVKK